MFDTTLDSFAQFFRSFRRTTPFPVEILLPGLLILFAWPLLRIWLDDASTTFMVAFVLGMGLRLAMKSRLMITPHPRACLGPRHRRADPAGWPRCAGPADLVR